jgi:hypothetical protein
MSSHSLALGLQAWRFLKKHRGTITKVAAIGGVCVAAYTHVFNQGFQKAERHYLHQIQLTEAANDRAVEQADRVYAERVAALTAKNKELENALAENAAARAADPRGSELGLDAGSVQRLNRIR